MEGRSKFLYLVCFNSGHLIVTLIKMITKIELIKATSNDHWSL